MRSVNQALYAVAAAALSLALAFAMFGLSIFVVRWAWDNLFLWATRP